MIAPPPIPNRPARMPVSTPPAMITAASSASSDHGMPLSTSGRDVRRLGARVDHEADRLAQNLCARAGLHRVRRDVAAEGARARNAMEQAEHVTRHGVQPRAVGELALYIRDEGFDGSLAGLERRG